MQKSTLARQASSALLLPTLWLWTLIAAVAVFGGCFASQFAFAEPATSEEPPATDSTTSESAATLTDEAETQPSASEEPVPVQVLYHFADRELLDRAQSFADYDAIDTVVLNELPTVTAEGVTVCANRHPDTITVATDPLHFAVVKDYASSSATGPGPTDLTAEAAYDPTTGMVTLPPAYAGKNLTIIFYVDRALNDQQLPLDVTVTGIGDDPITLTQERIPLEPAVSVHLIDDEAKARMINGLTVTQAGVPLPTYTYANGSLCVLASSLGGPLSIGLTCDDDLRRSLNPESVAFNVDSGIRLMSIDEPAVGDMYTVQPEGAKILGSETTNNTGEVAGWPEKNHTYGFAVHFFEDKVTENGTGRVNNDFVNADWRHVAPGGYINGYDYLFTKDWHFAWGNCKGDVADNGGGWPVVVTGWIKTTDVDRATGTISYEFELTVKSDTDGHPQQTIIGTFQLHKDMEGALKLEKRSANPGITTGNAAYGLNDAVYGVYKNVACTEEVATITTRPQGSWIGGTVEHLTPGNYWVREKKSPKGFATDATIYPVTVQPNQTATVTCGAHAWVEDVPQSRPIDLLLTKRDKDAKVREQGDGGTQGGATLAFAQFTVDYYDGYFTSPAAAALTGPPLRTWVFQTDGSGQIHYGKPTTFTVGGSAYPYKVSGPELFTTTRGEPTLPLGTIVIRETKPPAGYLPSGWVSIKQITATGTGEIVDTYTPATVDDQGIRADVSLIKHDNDTRTTQPQGDATLAGVRFEITTLSEAAVFVNGQWYTKGQVVTTLTTDADGRAATTGKLLPYGRYAITEVKSSTGYLLTDGTPHEFEITEDGVTVAIDPDEAFYNAVIRGGVAIGKYDSETREAVPQGDASLAGVSIEITNRSANAVVVGGRSYPPGQVCATLTTNEAGVASSDAHLLPYGSYELREVKAPTGYLLTDGEPRTFRIREDGVIVTFERDDQLYDQVIRGDVSIVKHDRDTREAAPQGDAKLDQTQFEITTLGSHPVLVGGVRYNTGDVVATIITNAAGVAATVDKTLPYGRYKITEVASSVGYRLTDGEPREFSITEDGVTVAIDPDQAFYNAVIRGGVSIAKFDAETREATPQGDAHLDGVKIEITNKSINPVVVNGTACPVDSVVATLTTDKDGVATSSADLLPYGSYELKEVEAPEGYRLTDGEPRPFQIREEGLIVTFDEAKQLYDAVIRGGVAVQKLDRESGAATPLGGATLAGAEFEVTNSSAEPVVVDGVVKAVGEVVLTLTTDETGAAATDEDALPYGTYAICEVSPNEGYLLTDGEPRRFSIREDGVIVQPAPATSEEEPESDDIGDAGQWKNQVKRGDLEFQKVGAGTMTRLAGVPFALISQTTGERHVLVTDENGYVNTASEWNLHSRSTNANDWADTFVDQGAEESAATPESDDRQDESPATERDEGQSPQESPATPDPGQTNPETLRRFLDDEAGLWFGAVVEGDPVAVDDDLGALPYDTYRLEELPCEANAAYELVTIPDIRIKRDHVTVKLGTIDDPLGVIPAIETTAQASDGGEAVFAVGQSLTCQDVVSYRGLKPGVAYHLTGELIDKATGAPLMDQGNPVVAELDFTPEEAEGTVTLPFVFDGSALTDESELVVFETLTSGDKTVAEHKDLDDEDQTLHFIQPLLTSQASDQADGDQVINADAESTIVDTVTLDHLTVGQNYVLRSLIIDPGTAETGPAVTLFNGLTPEANEKAGHGEQARDFLLSYWDSIGIPYTDDYANQETQMWFDLPAPAIDDASVELAKASNEELMAWVAGDRQEFRAMAETMEVQSVYDHLDTRGLAGQTLRCFQMLEADGSIVATEVVADYADEEVTVVGPTIGTTATDAADGDHYVEPADELTIADRVSYTDLVPGADYELVGTLMNRQTGEPVLVDGTVVAATTTFTPTAPDGDVVLDISFDGSTLLEHADDATSSTRFDESTPTLATGPTSGLDLVVFESLTRNDFTIAVHHDLNDSAQTITVLSKPLTQLTATPTAAPSVFSKTIDAIKTWWWLIPLGALAALAAIALGRKAAGRAREVRRQGATQRALLHKIERDWSAQRGDRPIQIQAPPTTKADRRAARKARRSVRW